MNGKRLESWKEIAQHLGCDVRSAQRFEAERGLPVHRLPGARSRVFAYLEEVDAWMRTGVEPAAAARSRLAVWLAILGVLLVAISGFAAWWVSSRPGPMERAEIKGSQLLAYDKQDRVAWRFPFPQTVYPGSSDYFQPKIQYADLDRDGRKDVLAAVAYKPNGWPDELFAVAATGMPLWTYTPEAVLRFPKFRQEPFAGPWHLSDMVVLADLSEDPVWIAVCDGIWWPSFLAKLNRQGIPKVQFVNSGAIYKLFHVQTHKGRYIIGVGVHNERASAMLFALKLDHEPARSPQEPGKYFCDNCPVGDADVYILLPPSHLHACCSAAADYNTAHEISQLPGNRIRVQTLEEDTGAGGFYEFDADDDFKPVSVSFSDGYWRRHEQLEREGKIHHTAADCPDRRARRAQRWDPGSGWKDIVFPGEPR